MANEQENDTLGNSFGIQDTMDLGIGNTSLLDNFLDEGAATATSTSDDLVKIVKEVEDPNKPVTTVKGKTLAITTETPEPTADALLEGFLGTAEDSEEDDDTTSIPPAAKDNKVTKITTDANDDTTTDEVSNFEALASDLYDLGVFTKEDDEESPADLKKPEAFLEKFQAEKKKGAIEMVNNFIGQFGEDYQEMFEAVFVKGVDPKDYISTYNNIVNFSELDLSVESNQEKVIRQGLKDQGFDPEDIDTEVERYRTYGDLETVANKLHKVLVKKESAKLAELEVKSERELQNKAIVRNQYITNVQTILQEKLKAKEFDGIPLNPKLAGELQDFLLVDKYKTASGETLTDFDKAILEMKRPENHAQKVKVALILKLLEKDPTLSTIQKAGVTKQTDSLFTKVARQQTKEAVKSTSQSGNTPQKSWFS
jgi:hypothetical protein